MRYRVLRRNSEFGRVYARGKAYVEPALVLYVLKTRTRRTRVGLTASKKVGNAVKRNRARRIMKAALDEHLDYNIGGYDIVLVARTATPKLKSWQLSKTVAKLFEKAGLPDKALAPGAPPPATRPPQRYNRVDRIKNGGDESASRHGEQSENVNSVESGNGGKNSNSKNDEVTVNLASAGGGDIPEAAAAKAKT